MSEAAKPGESPTAMAHEAGGPNAIAVSSVSGSPCVVTSSMAPPPASLQTAMQQNTPPVIAPAPPQSGTTTITTMSTLHQPLQHPLAPPTPQTLTHPGVPHSQMQQVQVIQPTLQNPTYLQQLYNTQGQLLMPGNIQLHPAGMNPSIQSLGGLASFQFQAKPGGGTGAMVPVSCSASLAGGKLTAGPTLMPAAAQVIAAGKPFQPNQLGPHMLTQGKSVLQGGQAGMFTSFPGYATIPTTTNQTLVISQLGVISSQPNILPAHSAAGGKPGDMQKAFGTSLPQGIAWATPGGLQSPALLTTQNPIFIRGTQQDGMFIQSPPPQAMQTHNPALPAPNSMAGAQMAKPRQSMEMPANIQPKAAVPRALSNILPSVSTANKGTSSSISTQTSGNANMSTAQVQTQKTQAKIRTKPTANRASPAPGIATQKADAANQTKPQPMSQASQLQITANKVVLPAPTGIQTSAPSPTLAEKSQQTMNKATAMQHMQMKPSSVAVGAQSEKPTMTVAAATATTPTSVPATSMMPPPPTSIATMTSTVTTVTSTTVTPAVSAASVCSMAAGTQTSKEDTSPKTDEQSNGIESPMEVNENVETEQVKDDKPVVNGEIVENGLQEEVKDKGPPKALVKPQVLTHVIEGFVIQEASEPFAVNRSSLLNDGVQSAKANQINEKDNQMDIDEPPKKKMAQEIQIQAQPPPLRSDMAKCEFCGKVDYRSKFKKSKKFCSISCAKRYNVGCSKRVGIFKQVPAVQEQDMKKPGPKKGDKNSKEWQQQQQNQNRNPDAAMDVTDDNTDTNDSASGPESSLSPSEAPEVPNADMAEDSSASESVVPAPPQPKINPLKWTVADVYEFVKALPDCSDYADDFAIQEIDGQALMLLKEDHLMSAMSMKLGPALKICAKINAMRGDMKDK